MLALTAVSALAQEIYDATLSGVRGDGGEYTAEFRDAVAEASEAGVALRLPSGTFSIVTDTTIDLTGIPEVIGHGTTIDCSRCTALDVLAVNGSKTLLRSRVSLEAGSSALDIRGNDVELVPGDTIIVTSVERHPNYARDLYYKGSRTYVDSIGAGEVLVYPQLDFDYAGTAYVWKVDEQKLRFSGITMLGNPERSQTGLRLRMADADVDADFRYFARGAVRFETSQGTYTGSISHSFRVGANSYGVIVADLSDVAVSGAFITGTRHAVAVGGGTMLAEESGGRELTEDARFHGRAAYPSSATVNGGTYGSSSSLEIGAIDAHGIAKSLTVTGATIYGGINVGAIESAVIAGNTIYHRAFPALNISEGVNRDWGSISFRGNTSIFVGEPDANAPLRLFTVSSTSNGRNLDISGNLFRAQKPAQDATLIGLLRNFQHLRVSDNVFDFPSDADLFLSMGALGSLTVRENDLHGVRLHIFPQGNSSIAHVTDNMINGCAGPGIKSASYSLEPSARFAANVVKDNFISGCVAGVVLQEDLVRSRFVEGNHNIVPH